MSTPFFTSPLLGEFRRGWGSTRRSLLPVFATVISTALSLQVSTAWSEEQRYSDLKCEANEACALLANGRPDYSRVEAEVVEIIDADSIRLKLHILPGLEYTVIVRSLGVDTPEIRDPKCDAERELGQVARKDIADKFGIGRWVYLENIEYDKYGGRILADVYRRDSDRVKTLTQELIETGKGVEYMGEGPRHDWCTVEPKAANDNG